MTALVDDVTVSARAVVGEIDAFGYACLVGAVAEDWLTAARRRHHVVSPDERPARVVRRARRRR